MATPEVAEGEEWKVQAEEFKAQGNEAFKEKRHEDAVKLYSQAIELDDQNHVYFSNRSAAYLGMGYKSKALKDGEMCVKLMPSWAKGYGRLAAAQHALGRFDPAIDSYKKGLKLDANNAVLKQGLEAATAAGEVARKARWEAAAIEREAEEKRREEAVASRKRKREEEEAKKEEDKKAAEEAANDPLAAFLGEVSALEEAAEGIQKKPKTEIQHNLGTAEEQVARLTQPFHEWLNLNSFSVLQLPIDADMDDITQRYRKLSTLVHPDKSRLENAREAFEEVKKAYVLLQDEDRRRNMVRNIEAATKRATKARKEKLKKGHLESALEPLQDMIDKEVKKHFADMENRRRNLESRTAKQRNREQAQEDAEVEKVREGLRHEKKWGENREGRMDSWLGFTKVGSKVKKKKMWSAEERADAKSKNDFSGVEQSYKKDWK